MDASERVIAINSWFENCNNKFKWKYPAFHQNETYNSNVIEWSHFCIDVWMRNEQKISVMSDEECDGISLVKFHSAATQKCNMVPADCIREPIRLKMHMCVFWLQAAQRWLCNCAVYAQLTLLSNTGKHQLQFCLIFIHRTAASCESYRLHAQYIRKSLAFLVSNPFET